MWKTVKNLKNLKIGKFLFKCEQSEELEKFLSAVPEGFVKSLSAVADVEAIMLPTQKSPDRRRHRKVENSAKYGTVGPLEEVKFRRCGRFHDLPIRRCGRIGEVSRPSLRTAN